MIYKRFRLRLIFILSRLHSAIDASIIALVGTSHQARNERLKISRPNNFCEIYHKIYARFKS